jgi:hypothetical protein
MEQPAFHNSSSNDPTWSLERFQSSKPAERRRSACDACHEAKTKCSGGATCFGCQLSGLQCTYSLISRLGRPKGSKNKRTLRQQGDHDSRKNKRRNHSPSPEPRESQGHQRPQQPSPKGSSDRFTWGSDLDQTIDATFAANYTDNALDSLLCPDLISFNDKFDDRSVDQAQSAITDHGLDSVFAKVCKHLLSPFCPGKIADGL